MVFLLRSRLASRVVVGALALACVAMLIGPGTQSVIVRTGVLGQPMPLVVAAFPIAFTPCLYSPSPELEAAMPVRPWRQRSVVAGMVAALTVVLLCLSTSSVVGLDAAIVRNVMLSVSIVMLGATWLPDFIAWMPAFTYLAASWFWGTPSADRPASAWAIPVHEPNWFEAILWSLTACLAVVVWVAAGTKADRAIAGR